METNIAISLEDYNSLVLKLYPCKNLTKYLCTDTGLSKED